MSGGRVSSYPSVVDLKPMDGYVLCVRYSDGVEGVVDLSKMVRLALFSDLRKPGVFESVRVGEHGEVYWTPDANLCSDSLYLSILEQREPVFGA